MLYLRIYASGRASGYAATVARALCCLRYRRRARRRADTERTFQYTVKDCLAVGPNQFTPDMAKLSRLWHTAEANTAQTGQFCRV